eukprot:7375956-Prymnesium_polylepis.3
MPSTVCCTSAGHTAASCVMRCPCPSCVRVCGQACCSSCHAPRITSAACAARASRCPRMCFASPCPLCCASARCSLPVLGIHALTHPLAWRRCICVASSTTCTMAPRGGNSTLRVRYVRSYAQSCVKLGSLASECDTVRCV